MHTRDDTVHVDISRLITGWTTSTRGMICSTPHPRSIDEAMKMVILITVAWVAVVPRSEVVNSRLYAK